jgi:hypothetical protein
LISCRFPLAQAHQSSGLQHQRPKLANICTKFQRFVVRYLIAIQVGRNYCWHPGKSHYISRKLMSFLCFLTFRTWAHVKNIPFLASRATAEAQEVPFLKRATPRETIAAFPLNKVRVDLLFYLLCLLFQTFLVHE